MAQEVSSLGNVGSLWPSRVRKIKLTGGEAFVKHPQKPGQILPTEFQQETGLCAGMGLEVHWAGEGLTLSGREMIESGAGKTREWITYIFNIHLFTK